MHPGRVGRTGRIGGGGLPFTLDVTGAQLRDALADPSAWGLLPHNLIPHSDLFSDAGWLKGNIVVAGGVADPFGGTTAFTVTENSVDGLHYMSGAGFAFNAGETYTASAYMRAGTGGRLGQLAFASTAFPASGRKARFNLATGLTTLVESGVVATMIPAGGGWYRCTMTATANASATAYSVAVGMYGAAESYLGDGASNIQVDRAQLNLGPTALFPVQTAGTASTQTHGWLLPGLGGARLSGDCRTSVAMQTAADGTVGYAAHNLLLNSATMATQTVTVVSGATYTLSAYGTGSIATSGAAVATLTGTGAADRVSVTVTATTPSLVMTLTGAMDRAQLNLGPVALPYVPTTTAARYGPAIDWLSGIGAYGIRSEAARTNLVLWSADMSNAAWLTYGTGATKVSAATALGAVPMYRVNVGSVGGAISDASAIYRSVSSLGGGTQYTVSAIVRSVAGTSAFRLSCVSGSGDVGSADLLATTTPQTFSFSFTPPTAGGGNVAFRAATAGGVVGDIEVGGFQLELGTEASSPILTFGAAATRAADTLVVLDTGWINQGEGTLAADYVPRVAGTQLIAELDDATANERLSLTNDGIFTVIDGGASQAAVDGGTPTAAALNKVAASYAANAFAVSLNNGAVVTDTSGTLPTVTRMDLSALDGHITRMRYSRRRASDGALRSLTT